MNAHILLKERTEEMTCTQKHTQGVVSEHCPRGLAVNSVASHPPDSCPSGLGLQRLEFAPRGGTSTRSSLPLQTAFPLCFQKLPVSPD